MNSFNNRQQKMHFKKIKNNKYFKIKIKMFLCEKKYQE